MDKARALIHNKQGKKHQFDAGPEVPAASALTQDLVPEKVVKGPKRHWSSGCLNLSWGVFVVNRADRGPGRAGL